MSLSAYSLAQKLLFRIDAERSHDVTLNFLARTQHNFLVHLYKQSLIADPVTVAGIRFANRVGLAAGLDKDARCIDAFFQMGFGFVEVGTVTLQPQPGNLKPRLFRLPQQQALINRFGFNNAGVQQFIENVKASKLRGTGQILGINIGKNADVPIENATAAYCDCLSQVYPYADYITINISSPNTKNLRQLQNAAELNELLAGLNRRRIELGQEGARQVPLFVKIAPDLDDEQIKCIAQVLRQNDIDGAIATNTTLDKTAVQHLLHGEQSGGLSGRPLFERSNEVLFKLRQSVGQDFPLIGVGGILSAEDAAVKIQAGADLVQIYSGLIYHGHVLIKQIAQELSQQGKKFYLRQY